MFSIIIFSINNSYYPIEDSSYEKIADLLKLDTSMIQKIEFLGNDEGSADWGNWKITLFHSNYYSTIERAISSVTEAIIFKQEVLNKENLAKCNEGKKELIFSQLTSIDEEFFKILNSNEMQSILKKCSNIAIKVVYCGTSYSISAQNLLQCHFFDKILFGSFKKYELTCISNQLQFTLPESEYPFVVVCLEALVERNSDNFKMWSLLSLTLALLGTDYFGHPEMEKRLIQEISYQKTPPRKDLLKAIEYLFLYNKRELIPLLMKKDGLALQYVNDELKNDFQVVSAACENNPYAIRYACYELRNNREFILHLLRKNRLLLKYASDDLKNNFEIVSAACGNFPYAIIDASDEIRNSREFMLPLLQKYGLFLEYASDGLKNNFEVVSAACKKSPYVLQYASDNVRSNREFMLSLVQQDGRFLQYASDILKNDPEFVSAACKNDLPIDWLSW
ncbi:MAG: DUF4116 domain-containing protein [Chlamydia sp.]